MTLPGDISISKALAAAMWVALAEFAIAPRDAQASCGDYVLLGGHTTHSRQMMSENYRAPGQSAALIATDLASIHANSIDPAVPLLPLQGGRCSGPNCSNGGPHLPAVPAVPVENDVRDWGLMPVDRLPTNVVRRIGQFADEAVLAQVATGSVYRPPR